ncbi:hypothetical protein MHTCC0001_03860 [Flavobacteriaceae bacterium MHTCC 0001]
MRKIEKKHFLNIIISLSFIALFTFVSACDSDELSSNKDITEFVILGVSGEINNSDKTINLTLPEGTDVTALTPTITISEKATVQPSSNTEQDFTNPVTYTVTAEDDSSKAYIVTVETEVLLSPKKDITEFVILGVSGEINNSDKTINLTLPEDTDVTALTPTITISEKATVQPSSNIEQDFTNPIPYTVTAEDNSSQVYIVTVEVIVNENIYAFMYNSKTYEIVKENKTWEEAAQLASERGGYLAEIDSEAENTALYNEAKDNAGITLSATTALDGGGASYLWLGGNDITTEGTWVWNGNNDTSFTQFWQGKANGSAVGGLYNNWGNEPDDFQNNQDALGLALTKWPISSGSLGTASQWNDVNKDNKLYFIIEYDN